MSVSDYEASDKCLGQDDCISCPRYMDDCDGKEDLHGISHYYGDSLKKFGFNDFDIDFTNVNHEDVIALCEWIKKRMEEKQ